MARWKAIPIVVGIIVMVYGGFLFAQAQPPPPDRGGPPGERDPQMEQMIDMMFRNMDTNHDGRISESEWMAFQEKQFRRLDKSDKGYITRGDVRADMMERMRAQQQQQRARPPQ
ncbi:MAG: hypothetical protein WB930_01600 [Syntrophobacteraceae bacterium]